MSTFLGVIPARLQSTRLPQKPLADIHGKPMIQRVYEQASLSEKLDDLVIATDSDVIANVCHQFKAPVVMTSAEHTSGTDRIAEVAQKLPQYSHYVNIQGDEPLLEPSTIDAVISEFSGHEQCSVTTAAVQFFSETEFLKPSNVKVVLSNDGKALYFSRSPIPFYRDGFDLKIELTFKHLGIYGYTRDALLNFTALPVAGLEQAEKLEQLRFLSYDYDVYVAIVTEDAIGVDTPEDLEFVRKVFNDRNK